MSLFDPEPPPDPDPTPPAPHAPTAGHAMPIPRVIDSYDGVPCDWTRPDTAPHRPGEPCGLIHDRCRGHQKASRDDRAERRGDPCRKAAVRGGLVCTVHGGSAPQVRAAATARREREDAQGRVGARLDEAESVIDQMTGVDQLLMEIRHAGAMALGYRWLLDELPERSEWSVNDHFDDNGKVTRLVNVERDGLLGPDDKGVQKLHVYEEGLRHWTKLHADLLVAAAKLGLEERRTELAERQVRAVGDAIRSIVVGLGRQLDDPEVVPVVEASLRLIAGADRAGP